MAKLGLRANMLNKALSQYEGYNLDSMAVFNGKSVGINEDGIYELFTGDTDNGEQIYSRFDLPQTNLGTSRNKRMRAIYVGGQASQGLKITAKDDEHYEASYEMKPVRQRDQGVMKTTAGRNNNKGCYFTFRIENLSGGDFSIDYIEVLPVLLTRRPSNF